MENIYKRFVELVTRWRLKIRRDEFFVTRVRLSVLYTTLAVIFLVAFSTVLYESLNSRLSVSAQETISDPSVRAIVLSKADGIIRDLILFGDSIVLFIVVSVGFFLTRKTLEPIRAIIKKQERFIADASHELRTPLTVMKTTLEVALKRKEPTVQAMHSTLLDTLDEVNVLTMLANDLLDISKDSREGLELTKIFLPTLLEMTIKRLCTIAEEKQISLTLSGTTDKDKYVMGNEQMINQVFYNLIYNALLYTPENGSVKVNCFNKHNRCVVKISDTGVGISKENLKHIFEPFYRADNSRTISGSGLGLSIVKSYVDLHLGAISIESEVNKGTNATVELPSVS